jgi:hypothetical protein
MQTKKKLVVIKISNQKSLLNDLFTIISPDRHFNSSYTIDYQLVL